MESPHFWKAIGYTSKLEIDMTQYRKLNYFLQHEVHTGNMNGNNEALLRMTRCSELANECFE